MVTPKQLIKSGTEHAHQTALFAWCNIAYLLGFEAANEWAETGKLSHHITPDMTPQVPELTWFHAIPNGGSRGDDEKSRAIRGGQLKAEGVKTGVSDTLLPVRRGQWSGLYIEMKKPGGKPSPEQIEFGEFVQSQGFGFVVCDHWEKARDIIIQYLQS